MATTPSLCLHVPGGCGIPDSEPAVPHDGGPLRPACHRGVVGDGHEREVAFVPEVFQELNDVAGAFVEVADGLVGEENPGFP